MEAQWMITLSPLAALAVNVITQVIVVHLIFRIRLSIIIGIMFGLFADIVMLFSVWNTLSMEDGFVSILTYLALSFCYFAFLNLNMTSLRIRIARELLNANEKGLNAEILLQCYSPLELINRRIKRLEETGQIAKLNGKLILQSRKLIIFVYVSSALRRLLIRS